MVITVRHTMDRAKALSCCPNSMAVSDAWWNRFAGRSVTINTAKQTRSECGGRQWEALSGTDPACPPLICEHFLDIGD
jgi:hypothetical protein